jgi:hypothetical protein
MYLLSVAGLIACKDASLFEAFSGLWPPSSPFYKLLEIERRSDAIVLSMPPLIAYLWPPIGYTTQHLHALYE